MLTQAQRRALFILMAVLLISSAALSEVLRPGQDAYVAASKPAADANVRDKEAERSLLAKTSFQALVPTLLGVREVLASLMWVRADDYFHRGEYRPILKMVRQITTIDPHQLDVYATGAWHMAYNFMDKRLIEDGIQFLEEGCKNNDSVYDLYFELGYMHYDKTKRFDKAADAYQTSSTRGTSIAGQRIAPSYVRHQLAHATEKMGDIDRAVVLWEQNVKTGQELENEGLMAAGAAGPNTQAARHNLYITERRMNERLAAVAERERQTAQALAFWEKNVELADRWLKVYPGHPDVSKDRVVAVDQVSRLRAGRIIPIDKNDLGMKFNITRVAPRKLLVEGEINVLNLARVWVQFQDKDYQERKLTSFDFKMNECSLEWENVQVRQGKFKHLIDLDRDPADMGRSSAEIYPLKADEFEVIATFNPRLQAAFIQDRYGWSGEGLKETPDMKTDPTRAAKMRGQVIPLRYVEKRAVLKREDILASGKKLLYQGK